MNTLRRQCCVGLLAIVLTSGLFLLGLGLGLSRSHRAFDDGVRYGLIAQMDNPAETDLRVITKLAHQWHDLVTKYGSPAPVRNAGNK